MASFDVFYEEIEKLVIENQELREIVGCNGGLIKANKRLLEENKKLRVVFDMAYQRWIDDDRCDSEMGEALDELEKDND